jgi:hypothetical protein
MSRININNYEQFFLDFTEGNLNESLQIELREFLKNNPELGQELLDFDPELRFPLTEEIFDSKNILKIQDTDYSLIALLENDLKEDEQEKMKEAILYDPSLQKEWNLYSKTKLKADVQTVFHDKRSLKKKETKIVQLFKPALQLAAGLALLIALNFLFRQEETTGFSQGIARRGNSHIAGKELSSKSIAVVQTNDEIKNTVKKAGKIISPVENPEINFSPIAKVYPVEQENIDPQIFNARQTETLFSKDLLASNTEKEDLETGQEKDYLTFGNFIKDRFRKAVTDEDEIEKKKKFDVWDMVNAAAKGYEALTDKRIDINKDIDENGEVSAFAVSTGKIGFQKNIKK